MEVYLENVFHLADSFLADFFCGITELGELERSILFYPAYSADEEPEVQWVK